MADWVHEIPESMARIGVFVNASVDQITELLERQIIHAAQLHGDETPETCSKLKAAGYPVIKAFGVRDEDSLRPLLDYDVDAVVLDAFCPGEYGGSGKTFNWQLALMAKDRLGQTPVILSGGLNPDNVSEAIVRTQPLAVDVASGVESSPGVKDPALIRQFLQAVRSATSLPPDERENR